MTVAGNWNFSYQRAKGFANLGNGPGSRFFRAAEAATTWRGVCPVFPV